MPKNDFTRKIKDFDAYKKLPKNVGDLGKLIFAKGFEKLPKVKKIAQSGHTAGEAQFLLLYSRPLSATNGQFGTSNRRAVSSSSDVQNFLTELSRSRSDADTSGSYLVADYSGSQDRRQNEIWIQKKIGFNNFGQNALGQFQPQLGQNQFQFGQQNLNQFGQLNPQSQFDQGQNAFGQNQFGQIQPQVGLNQFGISRNQFGDGPNQLNPNSLGQNQLGLNQLGQNQLGPNQFGQNQLGINQFGQNQLRPNSFASNQFGQNQLSQNQIGLGQQFGQNQFGQNQVGQNQFGLGQQFGQNQLGPNQLGLGQQFGQNQLGQNTLGQNQFGPNQFSNVRQSRADSREFTDDSVFANSKYANTTPPLPQTPREIAPKEEIKFGKEFMSRL